MHEYAEYWDRGEKNVPDMTGARTLLDADDIPLLAHQLGFELPFGSVLDVGCGTGRIARHCTDYLGCDIAPSAIAYCKTRDINAILINGVHDLSGVKHTDWVVSLSVMTHIDSDERLAYLDQFVKLAPKVLIDIIPGDGGGDVAMWTAKPEEFQAQMEAVGYKAGRWVDMTWGTGADGINHHCHRYYYAERK